MYILLNAVVLSLSLYCKCIYLCMFYVRIPTSGLQVVRNLR